MTTTTTTDTSSYRIDCDSVLAKHPELADTADADLWSASIAGDLAAREVLTARYVPLALKTAKKRVPVTFQWDHKIEAGEVALLALTEVVAGHGGDPSKNFFAAIAHLEITRALDGWLSPVSALSASPRTRRRWNQIKANQRRLTTDTHTPTPAEVADACTDPAITESVVTKFLARGVSTAYHPDYVTTTDDLDALETDLAIAQIERGLADTDPDLAATLRVMTEYLAENGVAPSGAEVGRILGISSETARARIKALRPHMACLLAA